MPVTIDSLFGFQQLGESVALFEQPPQALRLQDSVFAPEDCYGDVYRFDREDFEMSLAPFVGGRKAPSKAVKTQDRKVDYISLAHIKVHKVLHSADLYTMRSPGEISDNAAAEVAKIRAQLKQRAMLSVERVCAMAMRGTYAIDATQFPDSDTNIAMTRAVTALAESASWATQATPIVSADIQTFRRSLRQATGIIPGRALFNKTVTSYLLGNTEVKDWITHTQRGVNTFETAMFERMGGLDVWEEYEGFYLPEGGSATPFISDNEFFLLPPDAMCRRICRLIQGFAEIPVQAIGVGGAGAPAGNAIAGAIRAPQSGYVEYALPIQDGDPPGIKLIGVIYFMPLVKIPTAIGYDASVIA